MRLIDADALIEFCAERWIPLNVDAVNMQPTIQPVATDTNVGDIISRQAAIDALHMHLMYRMGTDSNKKRLDDWINGLPSAQPYTAEEIKKMQELESAQVEKAYELGRESAQPEKRTDKRTETRACDCISRKDAIRWIKTECNPYGKPTLDFESGKRVMKHLEQMPSAQPEPERTMEEFMYGQDMGNPEDGSL